MLTVYCNLLWPVGLQGGVLEKMPMAIPRRKLNDYLPKMRRRPYLAVSGMVDHQDQSMDSSSHHFLQCARASSGTIRLLYSSFVITGT